MSIADSSAWGALQAHVAEINDTWVCACLLADRGWSDRGALGGWGVHSLRLGSHRSHLRDLMADEERCAGLIKEAGGIYADFSRQRVTGKTMEVGKEPSVAHTHGRPMCHGPGLAMRMYACVPAIHMPWWTQLTRHNGVSLAAAAAAAAIRCCRPQLLLSLAEAAGLSAKIEAMFSGQHINATEDRAVLHVATRARREQVGRIFVCVCVCVCAPTL
jgi:hypothetical protein